MQESLIRSNLSWVNMLLDIVINKVKHDVPCVEITAISPELALSNPILAGSAMLFFDSLRYKYLAFPLGFLILSDTNI